jgi:ketosteroid isomerase-like protein
MKRIFATILLVLAAANLASGQCSDADKRKLEAFDRAWGEAGQRGDQAFLQNVYADDYMNPSTAGVLTKAQAIENAVRAAERRKADPQNADGIAHDYYIINCTPNTATITHRNVVTTKVDGKEQIFYTRSVHFLEKRGGEWRVVSDAGAPLNDAGQLLYMEMEWADAVKKRDLAWLERHYAEAYRYTTPDGALNDKRTDIEDTKNTTFDSMELSDMNVTVNGDTAVITGINTLKGKYKNQDISGRYRFTDIFVKQNGAWKILASQGTRVAQQAATR